MDHPAWLVAAAFFGALAVSAVVGIAFVDWLMRRAYEKRQEQADG